MTLTHIIGRKNKELYWREAESVIDAKAQEVRGRFLSPGMDGVYVEKRDEAKAYLKAYTQSNLPSLAEYPYLAAETGLTAPTPKALAELWISRHNQSKVAGPFIEALRTAAKAQVRAARSQAAINEIVTQAVAQLDELGDRPPDRPRKLNRTPPTRPLRRDFLLE
jgi:hypothetical protein